MIDLSNDELLALINALEYHYDHTKDDESYDLVNKLKGFVNYKSVFTVQTIDLDDHWGD